MLACLGCPEGFLAVDVVRRADHDGINIRAGDRFSEDFLKISPNNRIPAMIDRDLIGG